MNIKVMNTKKEKEQIITIKKKKIIGKIKDQKGVENSMIKGEQGGDAKLRRVEIHQRLRKLQ